MNKIYKTLSLFSGGGFLDIGFINNGFQIDEAIEIEPYFVEAYNNGIDSYFKKTKNRYIRNGLIKHNYILKTTDASSIVEQDRLKVEYEGVDGIIGGPPCQDYSVGGKNAGIEGEKGRLIYSYFEIVRKVQPKFLFFENVGGLYKTKNHRKSFDLFVKEIEDLGYEVWHELLNVLDYGYPQDRPRIALVAFRKEIIETLITKGYVVEKNNEVLKNNQSDNFVFNWPQKKHNNPKKYNWPKEWDFKNNKVQNTTKKQSKLCVAFAFEGLTDTTPNQLEFFKPKSDKFSSISEGDTNRKSFKRLHRYRYSPTVAYGNNEVHLHPTEERRLSVREGLRLQTVPDEYILPSNIPLTAKFKLISNGVPTAIAELIATEIRRTLQLYYNKKQ